MKVTVLIENTAPEGSDLAFEPGLSLYIEYNGKKILLDAGISGDFAANAEKLGVDLLWSWVSSPTDTSTTPTACVPSSP